MQFPEVSRYTVAHKDLPKEFDGFKIVQLSDLHNRVYGKDNSLLVDMIDSLSPDIVIMTGDMFSHKVTGIADLAGMVKSLARRYSFYYVNGNHELSDTDARTFELIEADFARSGAVNLDNRHISLTRSGKTIDIYGLCYSAEYYKGVRQYKRGYKHVTPRVLHEYLGDSSEHFNILLAHNPLDFDAQAAWGSTLSFGGHVHGGSIRIPVLGGILSPERRLFPKYQSGIYFKKTHDGKEHYLIVSRGLGRLRINNKPDLVFCTLRKK